MAHPSGKFRYAGKNVVIRTDFENGHLSSVQEAEPDVFDVLPYAESEYAGGGIQLDPLLPGGQEQPASFAFHFLVEGSEGRTLTFRFHVLEKGKPDDCSAVYANPGFPVFSDDGGNWKTVESTSCSPSPQGPGWQVVTARHHFGHPQAHVAYQYPYTMTRLAQFAKGAQESPFCRVGVAGCSAEGRIIPMLDISDPAVPLAQKKVACFTGLQHAAELAAGWAHEAMAEFLLGDHPAACEARQRWLFRLIPIVNVDAVAEGAGRIHSSGRNMNREWARPDPVPEVGSIKETFRAWAAAGGKVDLFIDIHGFSGLRGRWYFFVPADEVYPPAKAEKQARLMNLFKKHVPTTRWGLDEGPTEAFTFFLQEFSAISLSVDGWVYPFEKREEVPDLASHYSKGTSVCALEDLRAAAVGWVRALAEFGA